MHYSFFKLQENDGYIGYPTAVVSELMIETPDSVIAEIDKKSENITKDMFKGSNVIRIGGGVHVPAIKLLPSDLGIVVAEVFPQDIDFYIGKYDSVISQANEDYIEHINNTIIQKIQEALTAEFQQWDAYVSMSRIIFGFHKNSISSEFIDHANDEYSHILKISDILVNSGVRPSTKRISFQDATDTTGILKVNLNMEEKAVKSYQDIIKTINDDSSPITIDLQTIISKENEHAMDLRTLLRYL